MAALWYNAHAFIAGFDSVQWMGYAGLTPELYVVLNSSLQLVIRRYNESSDTWTDMAAAGRYANGAYVVLANGDILAIGGSAGGSSPSAVVTQYNPASNTWTTKAPLPSALKQSLAVRYVDTGVEKVMVVGGFNDGGQTDFTYIYTPSTNTWVTAATFPFITSKPGASLVWTSSIDPTVLSGTQTHTVKYSGGVWTSAGTIVAPALGWTDVVAVGVNIIYPTASSLYRFNASTNVNTNVPPPAFRTSAGMTVDPSTSHVIVVGGTVASVAQTDCYDLNPVSGAWTTLPSLATAIGNYGYLAVKADGSRKYASAQTYTAPAFEVLADVTAPVLTSGLTAAGTRGTPLSPYTITGTNSPTTYAATGLPTGLSVNTVTGVISGTPTVSGTFNATISVSNLAGSNSATLVLTIAGALPVITSSPTKSGVQGTAIAPYTITATNTPTSFNAVGLPTGVTIDTGTGVISGTPLVYGTVNSTITATNVDGTGSATLVWTLAQAVPVITSLLTASCVQGTPFSYTIVATNSPTSYNATGLPTGLGVNTGTGAITGTPMTAAVTNVTISATNGTGTATATLVITIDAQALPSITSALSASGTDGTPFSYTITATNTPTSFSAASLPPGLVVSTSLGTITGTPLAPGVFNATIGAANLGGSDSKTLVITVVAIPPVITSPTTTTQQQGYAFSYTTVAANSPYGYSATGLPAGLSINPSTGVISGIPSGTGIYNVVISATNSAGTDTITLVVTLAPGIPIPTITSGVLATVVTGALYSYTITTDVTPVTYGASGLPDGLIFDSLTGTISGSVTNPGVTYVSLSATNGTGTGTATLIITALIPAPVITSSLAVTDNQFTAFAYAITATDTPSAYNATSLPLGLSVDTANGHISGDLIGEPGTFYVTISATNAGGTDTQTLIITVLAYIPPPPIITSSLTLTVQVDTPLNYTIVATNSPLAFTASGLPAGLHLNSRSGLIYGTPTTAVVANVTLTAANAGGSGSATLILTVAVPAPKTVHGTGVLVPPRAVIWGNGYVIDRTGALRVAAAVDKPFDEAKIARFPQNAPGSTFANQ